MKGYPVWFLPVLILVFSGVLASGVLLVPTTLALRSEIDIAWRLAPSIRIGVGALHTACSFAALFVVGALWSLHMRSGWRRKRHVGSGVGVVTLIVPLAVSAVGVFYLADEHLANLCAYAHLALGGLLAVMLTYHGVAGWELRRNARHNPVSAAANVR